MTNQIFISQKHPYHLVAPSPLPVSTGLCIGLFLAFLTFGLHDYDFSVRATVVHVFGLLFIFTVATWFYAITNESAQGFHTKLVQQGLRMGMVLFIVSEIMFFFAFFWSFFHYTLSPSVNLGTVWPPEGIQNLDIWHLPLGNTILLLLSGVTITAAHAALLEFRYSTFSKMLVLTIALGIVFLICQGVEYRYGVNFSWRDSVQGSVFFITTGFHGLHVTIGTYSMPIYVIAIILYSLYQLRGTSIRLWTSHNKQARIFVVILNLMLFYVIRHAFIPALAYGQLLLMLLYTGYLLCYRLNSNLVLNSVGIAGTDPFGWGPSTEFSANFT